MPFAARLAAVLVVAALAPRLAAGATFTVTTTADDGPGSLRQAIVDANADTIADRIEFQIASGVQTIAPATALPAIVNPVEIDGTTQPGFAGSPLIEIDGSNVAAGGEGLVLSGHDGSTIRALVINRFAADGEKGGDGILVQPDSNGHHIQGCYIGTDVTGTLARPNGRGGIWLKGSNITVGGTTAGAGNVLSGNGAWGIVMTAGSNDVIEGNRIGTNAAGTGAVSNTTGVFVLTNSTNGRIGGTAAGAGNLISGNFAQISIGNVSATGHVVQGNWIGTDVDGVKALSPGRVGIELNSPEQITIGGTAPGAGNVIVGQTQAGIEVQNAGGHVVIQGNNVGVDGSGSIPIANAVGIRVDVSASGSPVDVRIGGTDPGAANLIARNTGAGIALFSGIASNEQTFSAPMQVTISGNSIEQNGGLGIDIEGDGVTPNDALDADGGSNGRQNFPVITAAEVNGVTTTIQGTLSAAPDATYVVELFANETADPSGFGEGQVFLGSTQVVTDANGDGSFSADVASSAIISPVFTATATDADGNTSEFSETFPPPPTTTTSSTTSTTIETTTSTTVETTTSTTEQVTTTSSTSTTEATTSTTQATTTSTAPTTTSTEASTTTTSTGASTTTSTTAPTTTSTTTTTTTQQSTTTTEATTTTTTSTSMPTTSTTAPAAVEICGNCIDDDGDGAVDLADDDCCGAAGALTVRRLHITPRSAGAGFELESDARPGAALVAGDDVVVQVATQAGGVLCAHVPGAQFVRRSRGQRFRDPRHTVTAAAGVDDVVVRDPRNGKMRIRVAGRAVALKPVPGAEPVDVVVALRNPASPDDQARCFAGQATLRATRRGGLHAR